MFRRFIIPLFGSFIAFRLLGALLVRVFQLFGIPIEGFEVVALGYLFPYLVILAFGFRRFRRDAVTLLAITTGPVVLSVLLILVLSLVFFMGIPSMF